ncbi:MAG: VacJ family lipoprotein [candidate division NC10 bacterium]|nr:VacJ family lipoprotein [candidate division NC10 bacterium]
MRPKSGGSLRWRLVVLVVMFASAGPGVVASARAESGLEPPVGVSSGLSEPLSAAAVSDGAPPAAATPGPGPGEEMQSASQVEPEEPGDYDPWEPFNERMFWFNRQLDRFIVKPVAIAWDTILPDEAQQALGRAFDNVTMPRRFVNNLLQLKVEGAGRELARLLLNSTVGIAGLFDVAKAAGIEPSDKDTGQTLGVYGVGPGPYLVLPFLPPLTVRDGIGFGVDGLLTPISYVAPFAATAGLKAGETVNTRSLKLELFEDVEESALDLYSAVRNGYLQRRGKAIRE